MSHRGSRFKYQLPLLRDYFHACHALISARDVCITAIQPKTPWPQERRHGTSWYLCAWVVRTATPCRFSTLVLITDRVPKALQSWLPSAGEL